MFNSECGKCGGQLKRTGKTIETVDPNSNYEMSKVEVIICESCKERYHIMVGSGLDE